MNLGLLAYVASQRWALRRDVCDRLWEIVERHAMGEKLSEDAIAEVIAGRPAHSAPQVNAGSAIAVVPVWGVIAHRAAMVGDISGPRGTSTEALTRDLRAAVASNDVSAVVLDVDSPGGSVSGVQEMVAEVRKLRGQKPIIAVANSQAASAAYWLASAADELVVTPSGDVGSIGVYARHVNISQMMAQRGVTTTFIYAGANKIEGNEYGPLEDGTIEHFQSQIDAYYRQFVADVALGRGVSPAVAGGERFGQGRMYGATEAVSRGMADRVGTLDDVLEELAAGQWESGRRARAEALARSREALVAQEEQAESRAAKIRAELDIRRRVLALEALR